jgi:ABC-type multidrug transport system ATPase subunit
MGGKTTLITMSRGLQKPNAEGAVVAGMDIWQVGKELRSHVGYLSQRFWLPSMPACGPAPYPSV